MHGLGLALTALRLRFRASRSRTSAGVSYPSGSRLISEPAPSTSRAVNYSSKQALALGITQLILGAICIICQVLLLRIGDVSGLLSVGIWGGVLMIIAGAFGIAAARIRTKDLIVVAMALSILATVVTGFVVTFSSLSLTFSATDVICFGTCEHQGGCIALSSTLVACAVMELIAAIWASALCCAATCCSTSTGNSQFVVTSSKMCMPPNTGMYAYSNTTNLVGQQGQVFVVTHDYPGFQGSQVYPSYPAASGFPTNQVTAGEMVIHGDQNQVKPNPV